MTDTSAPRAISRQEYAKLFGPTTGDKIRLGDTDLYIEIEKDLRVYGDEALYGGGKTLRDGMAIDNQLTSVSGALDLVITNVVLVDPLLGVIKAAASTPTSTSSRRSRLWRRSATA